MPTQTLNDIMEFDHVIIVHEDGTITDAPYDDREYWAPELLNDVLSDDNRWEFFSQGYTGQDGYSGPIMHDSEFIGGQLERDIRETPGTYVALVSQYTDVCSECHEDFIDIEDGKLSHKNEKYDEDHLPTDDELYVEGWAIARLKDKDA